MVSTKKDFYHQVYDIVRLIPKGRVTSYGAIANYLRASGASRLVGYAMNQSHEVDPKIPAHRVVNRNGLLTGKHHFKTADTMQALLEAEGVKISNDQVENFEAVFWNPEKELF